MALSLLKNLVPKAAARTSRKPLTSRRYSSYGHHEKAATVKLDLEKRVVQARVVFPSPLGSSVLPESETTITSAANIENTQVVSAQEAHDVMVDRLKRFRQAILDAHEKLGAEYEHDLAPTEFPPGPNTLKGSFGTPDQPMLVPSFEPERIVGCQGGAGPRHHEILWHNLKKNKPLCCLECGQIFRLVDHSDWLQWAATEWDVNKQDTVQFFLPESE